MNTPEGVEWQAAGAKGKLELVAARHPGKTTSAQLLDTRPRAFDRSQVSPGAMANNSTHTEDQIIYRNKCPSSPTWPLFGNSLRSSGQAGSANVPITAEGRKSHDESLHELPH
jgi:hypothetical protein